MDFPVEATVDLNEFQDKSTARKILRSHGFEMKDLEGGRVHVKGYFFKLKDAKGKLEQLLKSQTTNSSYSSLPVPTASSGTISKIYSHRNMPPHASPYSPTTSSSAPASQQYAASSSPDQHGSHRHGEESFVIDADVFRYAEKFRKKDIRDILAHHAVKMAIQECGDTSIITLKGRSSRAAVGKLQSLMDDLSKSLRTQEVPQTDMNHDGRMLLDRILKNGSIHGSVLVCEMSNRLHLIGSSSESYELKQRLLGRPVDRSGPQGRTYVKSSRGRSSSAPPVNRKNTESAAVPDPSPGGATGYSPSKYQGNKQEGATTEWGGAALYSRGRSRSVSRENKDAKRVNGDPQDRENKPLPQKSTKKYFEKFSNFDSLNIKQKFKNLKTKRK